MKVEQLEEVLDRGFTRAPHAAEVGDQAERGDRVGGPRYFFLNPKKNTAGVYN
jgi:hypothetical protein